MNSQSAQEFLEKAGNVSLEYLNKFKSKVATTVVDTVYSVENITKTALPGNPVTREYEVCKHIGSAGPGLLWKIYAGYKKSTKQEAAVFVLHKKMLETYSKKDRDLIVEAFKKGTVQLARIKHPRILSLQHQLEESKDSLAFATEPCFCSLANAFGNHENMPSPLPSEFDDFKLYDVEIKYGLMQIAEGLSFLHKDVKLLHRNICPDSIIINTNGAWKIACFELSVTNINDPNDALRFPFKDWNQGQPIILNPLLDYLAPEYGLSNTCDCSSDMYSYGMLFYTVYNNGKPLYKCNNTYNTYVTNVEELKKLKNNQLGGVPSDVREYLKLLLHINSDLRPDANQVSKIPFFDDVAVKTLEYLDSSFQVDNLQKSMFFKSLPQIIDKLPKRVCLQRIIPCLEQEFINPDMIPFVLPNMFLIADLATNEEFVKFVLPKLKPVFKLQKPIQILLIILRHMNLLLSKTPPTDVKEHILPVVCRALEAETVEVQELCLSTLPTFANLVDIQSIKQLLIPRIRKLVLESQSLSVRVNALVCIGKLLEFLEKWIVLDDIIPILEKVTSRESSVLMAMLGIYKITLTNPKLGITKEILATKILPSLIPISVDNNLNMSQFNAYMQLIKDMLTQVESEHRKKLEQIEVMDREKSIIPYSFTKNTSLELQTNNRLMSSNPMDQLMISYGVDPNESSNSLSNKLTNENYQPQIQTTQTTQAKKPQLTLKEKQEAARNLQIELESNSKQEPAKLNTKMTENLMDSNLAALTKPQTQPSANNLDLLSQLQITPQNNPAFPFNTTSMSNTSNQMFLNNNNNFSMNAAANVRPNTTTTTTTTPMMMNQQSFNNFGQQPQVQPQMPMMTSPVVAQNNYRPMLQQPPTAQRSQQSQSQTSFFGNLALPPAPSTQSKQTTDPKTAGGKKTAFDDLADLLG